MEQAIHEVLRKLKLCRYSKNTQEIYLSCLKKYFAWLNPKLPENGTREDIENFLLKIIDHGLSKSTQNQYINAIKFYYEQILKQERSFYHFDRPRKDKRLPTFLSKTEVERLILVTTNLKHKVIISMLYSGGLRVSELINLKIADINSNQMLLHINSAKGNKDRVVPISPKILELLREYYREYRPKIYLINGARELQYTTSSINKLLKKYAQRAQIKKPISAHKLRHSYATHMLDAGVNIRYVQELLGHSSLKTTMIYTHINKKRFRNCPAFLITWIYEYIRNSSLYSYVDKYSPSGRTKSFRASAPHTHSQYFDYLSTTR